MDSRISPPPLKVSSKSQLFSIPVPGRFPLRPRCFSSHYPPRVPIIYEFPIFSPPPGYVLHILAHPYYGQKKGRNACFLPLNCKCCFFAPISVSPFFVLSLFPINIHNICMYCLLLLSWRRRILIGACTRPHHGDALVCVQSLFLT